MLVLVGNVSLGLVTVGLLFATMSIKKPKR
jgi:hypothetical protein